ncbi:type III pantothenate kinase [Flavobacterium sp.]|uniref:type III pantothenate kinase n=1 Tax=Flavobacterium sp. TaxID=239 RepID=UPI00286A6464|nr:type III pantothenate kinase [Flavobacterium sp.]
MLLAIDIGNTRIKGAVFEHYTLVESFFFSEEALEININAILKQYPKCTDLVVASVGNTSKESFIAFQNQLNIHFISHQSVFPFHNLYQTPQTLGIDRMVLASGAVLQYPNQNRLVIDAGTCITYDFIDSGNNYLGGAISPGIRLRYEALHQYTAKLPLLVATHPNHYIGNTTDQAIHVGVVQGILHEIDGFISQYQAQYPKIIIILTGGDTDFLAKRLKNTIFANSNFLLESLNQTFQYKIKND